MNTSPTVAKLWLLALFAVPLGATGVWSWNLHRGAEALRASVASLGAEQTRLRGEVAALEQRREALQRDLTQAKAARSAAEAGIATTLRSRPAPVLSTTAARENSATAAKPAPAVNASDAHRLMEPVGPHGNVYFPELFDDPHYAQVFMTWQRQRNEERFAALFASLSLSAADLARFKELLAQKEMAYEEVDGVMENQAMREKKTVDRSEAMQVKMRVNRTFDDEIKQTFGDAVFAQCREFLNGTGARQDFLDQLTLRLSYSGAPLELEQATQLTVLYNSSRGAAIRSGGNLSDLSDAFVSGAQSILKAEQIPGLLQIQTESRAGRSGGSSVRIQRTTPPNPPPVMPPSGG